MADATNGAPTPRDVVGETPPAPTPKAAPRPSGARSAPAADKLCDLHKILDLERDVHKGNGTFQLQYQVPDARLFYLSILTYLGRVFHVADFEPSELVTPPALVAYFHICAIFVLFLNDYRSATPSFYAQKFASFMNFNRLFNVLENAAVPPQIFEILREYSCWSPELMSKLEFVPSLAATLPLYDIPYLLHPLIFLHGHNHLLTRANQVNEFGSFLMQELFRFTSASLSHQGEPFVVRIGNLLGCVYNATPHGGNPSSDRELRYFPNWLSEVCLPFVNPATHRQHLRRTGLMPYTLEVFNETSSDWNVYEYLFQTKSATNFTAIVNCVRACSAFVKSELNGGQTLAQLRTQVPHLPGAYMITDYIAPTWHCVPIEEPIGSGIDTARIPKSGDFNGISDVQKFGMELKVPGPRDRQALKWPSANTKSDSATGIEIRNFHSELYQVEKQTDKSATLPDDVSIEERSESIHLTPDVLVFAPGDVPPSGCSWPMLAGFAVYNGNVDSTTLRAPNPRDSLSIIKSRYVDGYVSLRLIKPRFTRRDTYLILRRALRKIPFGGISMFVQSDTLIRPAFHQTNTQATASRWNLLWPFTRLLQAVLPQYAFSAVPNAPTPNMEEGEQDQSLYQIFEVWSSFRVMNALDRPSVENTFFGVNHGESIFGRNSTLNKFSHPAVLLFRP